MATFKEHLHLPVTMIDDSQRMLTELKVPLVGWSATAFPHAPPLPLPLANHHR
jgi:hypothetical protein